MEAEFSLIDVFSDRPFGGNQLAVFPGAEGLSDEVMQQLARVFNFTESTFVLPSSDRACTHRVRIFTPRTELPFAGHPTVGTAAVLASRNPGSSQFLFEEGIGPVTVIADGAAWRLILPSPEYETSPQPPSAVAVARALSLPETAVVRCWSQVSSCGSASSSSPARTWPTGPPWTRRPGGWASPTAGPRTCMCSQATSATASACTPGSSPPPSGLPKTLPPAQHA
jgi:trans-2,3-dihydro-3-hydroxyanthranilate isomerase